MNEPKKRILIVEDAPEIRRIIEITVDSCGYEFLSVANGVRALEELLSYKPDLIILDMMIPEVNGLEVLKQLKANPATQYVGVIICSGHQHKNDIANALELGAADFVTKPFEMDNLASKINAFFSSGSNS